MGAWISVHIQRFFQSEFRRNAVWYTGLTGLGRIFAMAQTILIARALGITEYGVYGLLFGTIGLVASTAGLQMGLTATVFVARYKRAAQPKAAAVITVVTRFGWIVGLAVFLLAVPFSERIADTLLNSSVYQIAIILGAIFVSASILSGIQDGIAQGFEIFGALAMINLGIAFLILISILPIAKYFGLNGVLLTILAGSALKYMILSRRISQARMASSIPNRGSGVSFHTLVSGFALPSMLVSLGVGAATWLGMFLLSRQQSGFDAVAIASTGLQWRGPVLLLTSSIGAVAVPAFSRLHVAGDADQSNQLRRKLALFNFLIATAVGLLVAIGSDLILRLYGEGFAHNRFAFSLIVLSTIPMVVANVYMQQLVGSARMWRQLWLHCPFLIILFISFVLLIPRYHALGYAISLLVGSTAFVGHVLVAEFPRHRSSVPRAEP